MRPRDKRRGRLRYDTVKRGIDVTVAAVGLVLTAPIQIVTAVTVLVVHGRPVLFRQQRPGKDEVIFELVKFRTMRLPDATHVTDAERLTRFGQFLRSTSLDELPSLWNVLKGDMSLVGPRPLLVEYLPLYSPEQARRHEVRPGITGLAQINGRNALTWEDKFTLDIKYVQNRRLSVDLEVLLRTAKSVLLREGINAAGYVTVGGFVGTLARVMEEGAQSCCEIGAC
ncbi:sugar transferase [Intrasporangium sp.]|uniref:sugar transferase n=1 Tax=Intrasporangium sp. TaxID=1925024 RepID=UPI0032220C69